MKKNTDFEGRQPALIHGALRSTYCITERHELSIEIQIDGKPVDCAARKSAGWNEAKFKSGR